MTVGMTTSLFMLSPSALGVKLQNSRQPFPNPNSPTTSQFRRGTNVQVTERLERAELRTMQTEAEAPTGH